MKVGGGGLRVRETEEAQGGFKSGCKRGYWRFEKRFSCRLEGVGSGQERLAGLPVNP